MKARALLTIIRDALMLLVGFGGIIFQQLTGQVNPWLLGVYAAMLSLPGAIGLAQLVPGRREIPPTPTPPSGVPSPSSSQQ